MFCTCRREIKGNLSPAATTNDVFEGSYDHPCNKNATIKCSKKKQKRKLGDITVYKKYACCKRVYESHHLCQLGIGWASPRHYEVNEQNSGLAIRYNEEMLNRIRSVYTASQYYSLLVICIHEKSHGNSKIKTRSDSNILINHTKRNFVA